MMATIEKLKEWFKTGAKPTEAQFHALIDSYIHKEEDMDYLFGKMLGSTYMGNAMPGDVPPVTTQKIFYTATTAGKYTNFAGFVIEEGEKAILVYDKAWSKITLSVLAQELGDSKEVAVSQKCVREKITELESDTKSTDALIGKNELTNIVDYIDNVYISVEGKLVSNNTCKVSSPIFVKKGEVIFVFVGGSGIAAIAQTDEQASFYKLLVRAFDDKGATKLYSYAPESDMYVSVGGIYLNGFGIYKGVAIQDVRKDISALNNVVSTSKIELSDNLFLGESQRNYGKMVLFSNKDVHVGDLNQGKSYRIPLENGKRYYLPVGDKASLFGSAYNLLVMDDDGRVCSILKYGGIDGELIGEGITKGENYLSFVSPSTGNNALYINLEYLPSNTNVVDLFYLTKSQDYVKVASSYDEISHKGIFITLAEFISNFINAKKEINERFDSLKFDGNNAFENKVIYVLGDSITWLGGDNCDGVQGQYSHQGWTEYVKNRLNPKKMKSYARSGATLSCYTTSSENASAYERSPSVTNILWNQVIRMANDIKNGAEQPDYILIAAGCNDAYVYETESVGLQNQHIAAQNFLADEVDAVMTSSISSSWYGEKVPSECSSIAKTLRWMKDAFTEICPKTQVILMTPLQSHYSTLSTQRQVTERMEECAIYLSWNTINQGKECGISRLQESKGFFFTYDGTHTSAFGANYVGAIIAKRLIAMLGV